MWTGKTLIPLPPTGFVSLFCAKGEWVANAAPAQARCGVWGMFRNCTECKALQKSAVTLHMCHGAAGDWSPRRGVQFTGTTVVKTGWRWCFRFRHRSYPRSTSCCRTLRKTACEAQTIGVSSTLRHCTASPSILGLSVPINSVWKKRRNGGRMAFFQARGGKRVILVIDRSERAVALVERGFQSLPWRVILGNERGNILFKSPFYWVWRLAGITSTESNFLTYYLPYYYLYKTISTN